MGGVHVKAKDAQRLTNILVIVGFIIMLASCLYEPVFVLGSIVMISCLIPNFLYNKCPHCKKHLGRNTGEFCHHCGGKID